MADSLRDRLAATLDQHQTETSLDVGSLVSPASNDIELRWCCDCGATEVRLIDRHASAWDEARPVVLAEARAHVAGQVAETTAVWLAERASDMDRRWPNGISALVVDGLVEEIRNAARGSDGQ